MPFEEGKDFGGNPNMTQEELYKQQRAFNKYLWDNNINDTSVANSGQVQKQEVKKSGFTK